MIKIFFLFLFLFNSFLYSCTLCATTVPKVDVYTKIYPKQETTSFDVTWEFHKEFSETLKVYDINKNKVYDQSEIDLILKVLVDYIKPIHYLTNIEYKKKGIPFEEYFIEPIVTNFEKITFNKNGAMVFHYNFELPLNLQPDYKLSLSYYDGGGNFDFVLKDVVIKGYNEFKAIVPKFEQTYIYFFKEFQNQSEQTNQEQHLPPILQTQKTNHIEVQEVTQEEKPLSFLALLSEELTKLKQLIESMLEEIKENNSLTAYFWLLLFSFVYGILHAIGPGHGKTLVSSYFINQNKSYMKAFSISSLIGITHTFSAFVLTLIVYHILGFMFSSTLLNIEQMATKVSAVIIITIALYLIYKKYKQSRKKFSFHVGNPVSFIHTQTNIHKPVSDCSCNGCKTTGTDLGVILAAGIIPCPGTVTIFLFTITLGLYFIGFISALFMSIGMSLVIYITAILSVKVRKSASTNTTIVRILEYGSLAFILFLGLILLLI